MRHRRPLFSVFAWLAFAAGLLAQNTPSSPVTYNPNTGALSANITVPSGKTLTVASGGALTVSGNTTLSANTSIGSVSSIELGYLDGVTSAIQTQLASKLSMSTAASTYAPLASPAFTGTATLPSTTSIGSVSSSELGYLDGVTSGVQAQIDAKSSADTVRALSARADALRGSGELIRSSSAHRLSYEDATVFNEQWANLSAWTVATGQVSGGKFYASNGNNPSGANRSFALAAGESLRLVGSIQLVTGTNTTGSHVAVGVSKDSAGGSPTSGTSNIYGIGFQQNSNSTYDLYLFNLGSLSSLYNGVTAGTWYYNIHVDADTISVSMTNAAQTIKVFHKIQRSVFGNVNNVAVWNSDVRTTSGSYINPVGARKSTATIYPRTAVEGSVPTIVRTIAGADDIHIQIPANYDSRKPAPLCIYFHGAGDLSDVLWSDGTNVRRVDATLLDAGYIMLAVDAHGANWGNANGQADYLAAYQYVRDNYAISHVVCLAQSMGGLASLNMLAARKIPCAAWAGIVPVTNLANLYSLGGSNAAAIETAYGFSGAPNFAAATAGFDPNDNAAALFDGVPMRIYHSADDTVVPYAANGALLLAKVAGIAPEASLYQGSGGHADPSYWQPADVVSFFNRWVSH